MLYRGTHDQMPLTAAIKYISDQDNEDKQGDFDCEYNCCHSQHVYPCSSKGSSEFPCLFLSFCRYGLSVQSCHLFCATVGKVVTRVSRTHVGQTKEEYRQDQEENADLWPQTKSVNKASSYHALLNGSLLL